MGTRSHLRFRELPYKKCLQKADLLYLYNFEDPDTSLTTLETELFKSSLNNGVSESFLTLLSTLSPSLVRGSKGGVQICLPVQSLGYHPRPTARMPMVVVVCVMWCTLSAAPELSMLSLFSCILGNSMFFLKILPEGNQKYSINQQHSSRSAVCCLVATHIALVSNGS